MSNQQLTHYRKVFKSDHLGVVDLEEFTEKGSDLIFTISHVNQEKGARVAGRKINANIAYFNEGIKPLVLNATNSKVLSKLANSCFVENWKNVTVQLFIDPTASLKGEVVGGVRINPTQVMKKQFITKDSPQFNNVISAYKRDGNFNAVLSKANLSNEDMTFISEGVSNGSL